MKHLAILLFSLWLNHLSAAASAPVTWNPTTPADSPVKVEWLESAEGRVLQLDNPTDAPASVTLTSIETPKLDSEYYAIDGQVKYTLGDQPGMLEMWSHFPAKQNAQPTAFFARTLADSGLLSKLSGDSDWRDFRLPFNSEGAHAPPEKLVINLHFGGKGTVQLKPAALNNYPNVGRLLTEFGAWWPVTWSGWIGGGAGAFFGCFGGLLGMLSQKGRARGFVVTSSYVLIAIGTVCLIAGIIALALSQPYHVFYPLLLLGVILTTVMLGTRKQMHASYQAAEERRMAAMDTLGHTAH